MTTFDFVAPAELYCGDARDRRRKLSYKRFPTGADAVRHVMEELSPRARSGAVIESEAGRFDLTEIELLYGCADFPLDRQN